MYPGLDPVTCAPATAALDWFLGLTGGTTGEINPRLVEVNAGLVVVMRITSTHSLFFINHVDIFFFFSFFFLTLYGENRKTTSSSISDKAFIWELMLPRRETIFECRNLSTVKTIRKRKKHLKDLSLP